LRTPTVNPDRTPVLEVRGATKRFGSNAALQGVDLRIGAGEIYALLGPNGAGKTTLIRAISGRLGLDAGEIRIEGHSPRQRAARRLFGLVPQSIALYPHLTARENLIALGRLSGVPAREIATAADRALARISLSERAGDLTETLSGGMQRRLNIAAGTLHHPRLLLLDEPTVGVDVVAREEIHALLRELRGDGLAVLLTTHDLDQASELADRVGILAAGRLLAQGPPDVLVQEIFDGARELIVTLSRTPEQGARELLTAAGLAPLEQGLTWEGSLRGGLEQLEELSRRLGETGTAIGEVRVREPGLRGVFFHLTGQELPP
jgi:ABC-2 type transport system ATP-binding protein